MADSTGYYAVIPAEVRYDKDLNANAKLLYGELTSLSNQTGYCWAKNEYFAELYGLSERTVSRLIAQLESKGYIRCEMAKTKDGSERHIYAGIFLAVQGDRQDCPEGGGQKCLGGVDKNVQRGVDKNVYQNNKTVNNKLNITPLPPTGGEAPDLIQPDIVPDTRAAPEAKPKARRPKTEPRYRPDWFERFWALYPRRTNRVAAVRAWDKLRPDLDLCRVMAEAIRAQMQTPQWRDGPEHIPHPSTWLNGARWLDEVSPAPPGEENAGGWAPDPEVY